MKLNKKVKDFMDNNGNQRIEIHLKEDRDPCTAFYENLWSGSLYDIPKEYQNLEVIYVGWAIGAQCYVMEVVKDLVKIKSYVVSNRLRSAREVFGISQEQLSMLTGISQNSISSMEHGYYNPSVKTALLICSVLNCKIEDIWSLQ